MPQVRFINIGGSGGKIYDTSSVPFSGEPRIVREIYGPHINPKRIIIVDEYTHTGQAIQDAEKVLREAFPEAKVFFNSCISKTSKLVSKWIFLRC
ncbi:MAG: hypothetical protein QXZ43_03585 [Candidatus Aenigmatarchaeota archaeon]